MLTLQDAQELVKNPEKARELAAAMIPEKISHALEKQIDSALINAIAQNKKRVSLFLGTKKEKDEDIVTYLYLMGLQKPKVEVKQWSCCWSLESDPFLEFSLGDESSERGWSSEK